MSKNKAKKQLESIELKPGPRFRHGGYTYLRTGTMPTHRRHIERYLIWVRQTYVEDIAGEESNLTAGQTVLLNKLVMMEGLCRCIETTTAEVSEKSGQLPVMPEKYLSYVNSIVKLCGMLGIERKVIEPKAVDLAEYVETKYGKEEK